MLFPVTASLLSFCRTYRNVYLYIFLLYCPTHDTFSSERSGIVSILLTRLHQDLGFTRHLGHSYYLGKTCPAFKAPMRDTNEISQKKIQIVKHIKRYLASLIVREMYIFEKVAFKNFMTHDNQIPLNGSINPNHIFESKLSIFIEIQICRTCIRNSAPTPGLMTC